MDRERERQALTVPYLEFFSPKNYYGLHYRGDGTQTRDFAYVSDVVTAFYSAAISEVSSDIFNVGSGKTSSVNEVVKLLEGDKTYIPKRPGEPDCTFADISKIQNILNWSPQTSLKQGVRVDSRAH